MFKYEIILFKRLSIYVKPLDFKVNMKIEEESYLIAEKKMQMIHLQAKVDALGAFNSKQINFIIN